MIIPQDWNLASCIAFTLPLKYIPNRVSNSWDMSPEQMLPGQMSLWQLESVLDVPRNLPVKFHQNRVSNSWDIPDMDKCREDKCYVDKCHPDSWNMF